MKKAIITGFALAFVSMFLGRSGFATMHFDDSGPAVNFPVPTPSGPGIVVMANDSQQDNMATNIAIQQDGKILVEGFTSGNGVTGLELLRFNPNGTLDTSFNQTGKVKTNLGNVMTHFVVQPDGKILAGGTVIDNATGTARAFTFVRYNGNGTPDVSFNGTGQSSIDLGSGHAVEIRGIAIQADGKILGGGLSRNETDFNEDFILVRLNADGTLDSSFNGNGKAVLDIGNHSQDDIGAVVIQPDGKIVVSGSTRAGFSADGSLCLVRYNPQGTVDTAFGNNGKAIIGIGSNGGDWVNSMFLQPDGKILVAAGAGLIRLDSTGALDTSFNATGKILNLASAGIGTIASMVLQSDGKIVVGGEGSIMDFAIARFNGDGSLDASLPNSGQVKTDIGGGTEDHLYDLALQSDGKIVAVGTTSPQGAPAADIYEINGQVYYVSLVKYTSTGSLDPSFGGLTASSGTQNAAGSAGGSTATAPSKAASGSNTMPDSSGGGCSLIR